MLENKLVYQQDVMVGYAQGTEGWMEDLDGPHRSRTMQLELCRTLSDLIVLGNSTSSGGKGSCVFLFHLSPQGPQLLWCWHLLLIGQTCLASNLIHSSVCARIKILHIVILAITVLVIVSWQSGFHSNGYHMHTPACCVLHQFTSRGKVNS